jgi:NAD(P)-dependent dehydrogenase (short-subunit alcohol dehydrogenase family)
MLAPLAEWRSRTKRIMLELERTTAIATGAAAGIGLGVAKALAGAGMNLALGVVNLRLLHSPRAQPERAVVEAQHVRIKAGFDLAEAWEKA